MTDADATPVLQMRLVVEADDHDEALRFYRDVLGLRQAEAYEGEGGARVAILEAGRATLELANPAQKRMIDEVEVGRPVAPKIRIAFEVVDSEGTTDLLVGAGATLIATNATIAGMISAAPMPSNNDQPSNNMPRFGASAVVSEPRP